MASTSGEVKEPSEEDLTRYRDTQTDDGPSKKKKFKPFKAVRRLFSNRRKKSKPIAITTPRLESVSDDDVLQGQTSAPGNLSSPLSMSADSIFTPDSQKTPVHVGQLREGTLSMEHISPQKALAAELKGKLRGRKIDGDDNIDDGLPDSPPTHQTTADVLNQMKEGKSAGSDNSLLSMDSSDNDLDDQDPFQNKWTYGALPSKGSCPETTHSAKSPTKQNSGKTGDIDLDVVQAATLLKSNAAKDRMHIRQKTKAPSRRRNQSPSSPRLEPTLSHVSEESPNIEKKSPVSPVGSSQNSAKKEKEVSKTESKVERTVHKEKVTAKTETKYESPQQNPEAVKAKTELKDKSPVHKQEEVVKAKTASSFSLKASPVTQKKDLTTTSPDSGKGYGRVVLRQRADKAETDTSKRQTVAMGSGVSMYEDKSKETPVASKNWDDLDKPKHAKGKVQEKTDNANSEFAQMFTKLTRRSSQKRILLEKEDLQKDSSSHKSGDNRESVATIDIKIESDSNSSSNNSRLKTVDIDIKEKKASEDSKNIKEMKASEDSKKDNRVSVQSVDVKASDTKSPVTKTIVKSNELVQDTKQTSHVIMRDSEKSKNIKQDRSSVKSIDVKIDKHLSVKSSEGNKDSVMQVKVEGTPKETVTKPSKLFLKTVKDEEEYRKSSPKMKDRNRSQTMPDTTEVSKVKDQTSPSLQRSKTSVDKESPKHASNTVLQSGMSKSEPKKIFQRTMEDGTLPPWFKKGTTTAALPSPTKEPIRKLSTEAKVTSPSGAGVKPVTQPVKDTKVGQPAVSKASSTPVQSAATKVNTGAVNTTSTNVTASKGYGAMTKPATTTTAPAASKTMTKTTAVVNKTSVGAGAVSKDSKDAKTEANVASQKADKAEENKAVMREKSTNCSSPSPSKRQSKVFDLMKNFQTQNVQPVN